MKFERKNFRKAGEILSEVWSSVVIDGHGVVAEYIEPKDSPSLVPDLIDEKWYAEHVRESQYLLKVVKCNNRDCCGPLRSALQTVAREQFLRPPYPILQVNGEPMVAKPDDHDGKSYASFLLRQCLTVYPTHASYSKMPYDLYCPSLREKDQTIPKRYCKTCGVYFASHAKLQKHTSALHTAAPAHAEKVRPNRVS